MIRTGRPDGADGQQSLGELVALAAKDMSSLVRYEISLAKSELKMDARRIGIVAGIAVVGLFVACLIVVLLCFALAYGLVAAFGIPVYAGFLCTVGACLVIIVVAAAGRRPHHPPGDRDEDDAEDRYGRHRHAAQERVEPERLGTGHQQSGGRGGQGHYGRDSARATVTARGEACRQSRSFRSTARGRTAR